MTTDVQPPPPIPVGKGSNCDSPRRSYRSPRAKLQSIGDVSHELAKLYREARANKIETADASKLAHILAILSRILSDHDLEDRIAALEAKGVR